MTKETFEREKNVLGLKHAVTLTKAGTFLALAPGSWISLFVSLQKVYNGIVPFLISFITAFVFFVYATKHFEECQKMQ